MAKRQRAERRVTDGTPLGSFGTLLEELASVTRNLSKAKNAEGSRQAEVELDAHLSIEQQLAMELLKGIHF